MTWLSMSSKSQWGFQAKKLTTQMNAWAVFMSQVCRRWRFQRHSHIQGNWDYEYLSSSTETGIVWRKDGTNGVLERANFKEQTQQRRMRKHGQMETKEEYSPWNQTDNLRNEEMVSDIQRNKFHEDRIWKVRVPSCPHERKFSFSVKSSLICPIPGR